jgi:hypothetical protein
VSYNPAEFIQKNKGYKYAIAGTEDMIEFPVSVGEVADNLSVIAGDYDVMAGDDLSVIAGEEDEY